MTKTKFANRNGQRPPGFYTYAYLREDGRPYYIGKGEGCRAWMTHGHNVKWKPPANNQILILKWGLSEAEAHKHEIYLINHFGYFYKKDGWLTKNFTLGGEGSSGRVLSEDQVFQMKLSQCQLADEFKVPRERWALLSIPKRKALAAYCRVHPEVSGLQYLAGDYVHAFKTEIGRQHQVKASKANALQAQKRVSKEMQVDFDVWVLFPDKIKRRIRKRFKDGKRGAELLAGIAAA